MSPSTETRENREFAAELKFVVSPELADQIREWSRACLAPDPNASGEEGDTYPVNSFYFDTDQFDVFHRVGSFGRSKYRIRRYGSSSLVFLERKLKTRGLVSKRRSVAKIEEIGGLAEGSVPKSWIGHWFQRRLTARRLRLICQIGYQRSARVAMSAQGPLRLTIDEDLRALVPAGLHFEEFGAGVPIFEGQRVVELKFRGEIPVLFKRLIEQFQLRPVANSKYRRAATILGLAREAEPVNSESLPEFIQGVPCVVRKE
jgi:hypothetical protein